MPGTVNQAGAAAFEVLTMGRVGVDLYPTEVGVPLEEVKRFGRYLGGSATNVAVAAARLGRRAAVITRTGDDPFGLFVHKALRGFSVDDRFVAGVPGLPTAVAFCEMFPPDDFPLWMYGGPRAPYFQILPDELDTAAISEAEIFWCTATGLSHEPSRTAHLAAWEARGRKKLSVLDLDYRAVMWESPAEARRNVHEALSAVNIAVGNLEEAAVAVGEDDPARAGRALLERGAQLAVIKQGPRGVLAMTPSETVCVPTYHVEVVNGLGAGDAFGGAMCHGLLSGWPLEDTMRFSSAAGAIVASRLECSSAMPAVVEVLELMTGRPPHD